MERWYGGRRYDADYPRARLRAPLNRVTAPYNLDYIRERGPVYPRNPNPYGGEWIGQIGGEEAYRPPYLTRGGTRTYRGMPDPLGYDAMNYGPPRRGRYPDEL